MWSSRPTEGTAAGPAHSGSFSVHPPPTRGGGGARTAELPPGKEQKLQDNWTTRAYLTTHQSPGETNTLWNTLCLSQAKWLFGKNSNQNNLPPSLPHVQAIQKKELVWLSPPELWFRGLSLPEVYLIDSGFYPLPFPSCFLKHSGWYYHRRTKVPEPQPHSSMVPALLLSREQAPVCRMNLRENRSVTWKPALQPPELITGCRQHFSNPGHQQGRRTLSIIKTLTFPYLN